eukprot:1150147-Pelagomonas_calceolata.AAC.2
MAGLRDNELPNSLTAPAKYASTQTASARGIAGFQKQALKFVHAPAKHSSLQKAPAQWVVVSMGKTGWEIATYDDGAIDALF